VTAVVGRLDQRRSNLHHEWVPSPAPGRDVSRLAAVDLVRLADNAEEISEGYARRYGITRDPAWFLLKLQEEVGELTQAFLMRTGQARSKGRSSQEIEEPPLINWLARLARCV
jgi:hypothetical protein